MGRPRIYQDDAQRAHAFRQRQRLLTVRVSKPGAERLQAAVGTAAGVGDPLAVSIAQDSLDGLLSAIADLFEGRAKMRLAGFSAAARKQREAAR